MAKKLWSILKLTVAEWSEDKASRLAAALSYYTIFSLAPLLVIAIAVAGLVFGQEAAQGAIVDQLSGLVGQEGAQQVQTMIQNASRPGTGIIATVVGVALLLFGASGVFGALQDAMNTIWEVQPKPGRGILRMIKDRFLSFTMVLVIGFLLLVSLVLTAALASLGSYLGQSLPFSETIMQAINFIVSFGVITLLFALMFKYLPDAKIAWKDVLVGGAVTALLFTLGKMAIGIYLGNSNVTTAYGAAGSLIVLLIWIYYSGQILFFGAEFTQVYANQLGSKIVPAENAERVTEMERTQQGMTRIPRPGRETAQTGLSAVEDTRPRTAVPSGVSPVPVTGTPSALAINDPAVQRAQWIQAALPMAVAFLIGIFGSLSMAREQRKRPLLVRPKK